MTIRPLLLPSEADRAEAEAIYRAYPKDKFQGRHDPNEYIAALARAAMHKRLAAEWKRQRRAA